MVAFFFLCDIMRPRKNMGGDPAMNKKRSVTGAVSLAAGLLLLALGIVMIGMALYLDSMLGKINRIEEQETLSPEQIQAVLDQTDPEMPLEMLNVETEPTEQVTEIPTESVETETIQEVKKETTIVNILLVGQDRRIHEPRQRSDAMILCTINTEQKSVVLTSFLRDTYVKLPGSYGMNRLNIPYLIGGFDMLDRCLEENFNVHVDHNIEVDFSGFKAVIDTMGGIDIELTQKEAEIVEGHQVVGMNHLDGGQALMYARIRKIDNDFERTNRQRKVLTVLFEKVRSMNLLGLLRVSKAVLPMITTDMTDEEILGYILEFAPLLDELEIVTQSVPAESEYEYAMTDGMSVVVPNMDAIRRRLSDTIGIG